MPDLHERVLVLAPLGRDAIITCQVLADAGAHAERCEDLEAVLVRIREGAGIAVLTEEVLTDHNVSRLVEALGEQPSWSDIPVLMMLSTNEGALRRPVRALAATLRMTILQRPVPVVTLVTTCRTLLSARRRQYEVRDLLALERRAREEAEQATRIKDEFLASVSHELRTPLSAIRLWTGLLERGGLDPEQALLAVRSIKQGAEAQIRLVEDLLELSRMMMGKLRLDRARHDVSALVTSALEVIAPVADAKGVRLGSEIDRALEALVDADRIQQVVWNILNNAVKFTPAGGDVHVRVERTGADIVIVVADTGSGISAESLPTVFDRFRQGHANAGRRNAGIGIGLAIAKELVQLHGGSIEATSEGAGRGATFTIRIPGSVGE
jgi:signal transduction histidine kinase